MKAYIEGGTNDGTVLDIGALNPQVTLRTYAADARYHEPQIEPGAIKNETYQNAMRTRNVAGLGVLPVYVLIGTAFYDVPETRAAAQERARKASKDPAVVIAGDEVNPPR